MHQFFRITQSRRRALGSLLCLTALLFAGGCVADGTMKTGIDPDVSRLLGPRIAGILMAPDRVDTFMLQPSMMPPENLTAPGTIAGYDWTVRGAQLGPREIKAFQDLVFDSRSHVFGVTKKCVPVPEYALTFHKGGEAVSVLLSFSCDMWRFVTTGRDVEEDFDPVRDRLKAIIETVFRM
jgi:hypothetical protein